MIPVLGFVKQPNILFAISDDQSWMHAGAYGDKHIHPPAFDRVAREGVLFTHAYCAAPSCAPSRAAILTGRHIWQLEEGGILFSILKAKFPVFTFELRKAGYELATMGKTWDPGVTQGFGSPKGSIYKASSTQAVFGPAFSRHKLARRITGISANDYAANFADFLGKRDRDKPFFSGTVPLNRTRTTRLAAGRKKAGNWSKRCCPSPFPTIP